MIYEFVNKLEHFDAEWFKVLVDSYPVKALYILNDIKQWQALCQQQFGTDGHDGWYNSAVAWYNKYSNTLQVFTRKGKEKVYYMQRSK